MVCNLKTLLRDPAHAVKIAEWALKTHSITRLASQLHNLHLRRCLEDGVEIPRLGHHTQAIQAWYAVTRVKNSRRSIGEELAKTRSVHMADVASVDTVGMSDTLQFEAERWAATFSTNVYLHFPKRVNCYVQSRHKLPQEEYDAMDKPARAQRRNALVKVSKDLCSDPSLPLASPTEYHSFVTTTRSEWKLQNFPWQMYPGMPLKYHMKANDQKKPEKCNAHLLLPAMQCMILDREARSQRGFAMLPLRTSFVPGHTHFGELMLRAALGLGDSEERKQQKQDSAKRRKLAKTAVQAPAEQDDLDLAPLCGGHVGGVEADPEGPVEEGAPEQSSVPQESHKRKVRPKAERDEARRRDLLSLFDLKAAKVHDCVGKTFNCTFTSDGYAAHLNFTRPKSKPIGENQMPRRGVYDIDDLRMRMQVSKKEPAPSEGQTQVVDSAQSPKDKLEEVRKMRNCLCCNVSFNDPFPGFICVGCDPGKNEPVVMADPIMHRKMRMTLADRRHHTLPANYNLTERHMEQKNKNGGWPQLQEAFAREEAASSYRKQYVDKPRHINQLESEIGQLEHSQSSHAATLSGFATYLSAIRQREPVLVPHYEQLHQRKLRFKAHVERQRYESKFIRDIKRTFDPEKTGKTIILFWGAWGKIAGRPGTVGNRGYPPTIGVGLVKRIAKEDGIVVAWTPEYFTTKIHHKCGGECVRFTKAEKRRAKDGKFRHTHKEIRGLKQCSSCGDPVNRDLNAALNIGTNGLLLLSGCKPIKVHDAVEVDTLNINNEMLGA